MAISAEEMARLSVLLDTALELDPDGRAAWLEALPTDLAPYRAALRSALLPGTDGSHGPDVARFETLPRMQDPELVLDEADPKTVGPYRLLRALGSGGMGTVWLAERSDGAYRRKVALKLPRVELAPGLLERWARERDILAGLEHPKIARLYDAGVDASHQPYLVLEFVDGQPIDQYAQALDLRGRITLFLQVTEAVGYAHARGVIHRDLKPSNILVDAQGQVHLLDFGIAKIMESDASAGPTQLTELAGAALTPDFASPEQLCGERIRVTSDIYSLAVILYFILSGALPYQFSGRRTQAIAAALRDEDPPPASRRAATPQLARLLRGDLDAILAQALRKSPDERYASVADFDADLRRYLDGHAVRARRQGWLYQCRKFGQRQRATLLRSAALAAISLGLGYSLTLVNDRLHPDEAAPGRSRMSIVVLPFSNQTGDSSQAYVAEGLTTSLTADLSRIRDAYVIDPITAASLRGRQLSAREIGERLGVRYVLTGSIQRSGERLRVRAQLADTRSNTQLWSQTFDGDQTNLFALQDEVTGRVGNSIGREMVVRGARESGQSRNPKVADLILRARAEEMQPATLRNYPVRESLWRQVLALDPENTAAMANLAVALVSQLDPDTQRTGDIRPGPKQLEGRDLALKARSRDPDLPEIYYALAVYYSEQGDFPAALQAAEKRLSLDPNSPNAYNMLGNQLLYRGDPHKAIEVLKRGLALDPDNHHPLDKILMNLSLAYLLLGDFRSSLDNVQRILEIEPLDAELVCYMAMDYAMLGDAAKASAARTEALRLAPDLDFNHYFLSNIDGEANVYRQLVRSVVTPAWRRAGLPGP